MSYQQGSKQMVGMELSTGFGIVGSNKNNQQRQVVETTR